MSVLKEWPRYFREVNNNLKNRKHTLIAQLGHFKEVNISFSKTRLAPVYLLFKVVSIVPAINRPLSTTRNIKNTRRTCARTAGFLNR
jgi:hypothetical protein